MSEETEDQSGRKLREGFVVSDSMDKTIVVETKYVRQHPLYKKRLEKSENLKAHDESEEATPGDYVRVEEARPMGAGKHWRLVDIVETNPEFEVFEKTSATADEGEAR